MRRLAGLAVALALASIVTFLVSERSARMDSSLGNITAGAGPLAVAVNPITNKIYVANRNSNNLTVIDGTNNSTITVTSGVGNGPAAVAVNPVTNKIYFGNLNSANVTVLDGTTNAATTFGTVPGGGAFAVAVNSVTNKIYVARGNGTVTVIDGTNNATTPITAGTNPIAVAVNPVTNKIYVANFNSNNVTVIDGSNNSTATVPVGASPCAVAINSVTNRIYVANQDSNNVTVIDGTNNSTTTVAAGTAPTVVAVNPVTDKVYCANGDSANVTVIDATNNNATTTVVAGTFPFSVAVNQITNKIYVANQNSDDLTVINGADNSTTTVATGTGPSAVTVNPVTNKAYVTNVNTNDVTVIDGSYNTVANVTPIGGAAAVAVNPATNKIYFPLSANSSVAVMDGTNNSIVTVPVGSAPVAAAVNPITNKIYVASGSGVVTVIDGTNNSTIPITAGLSPNAVAVNPVTNKIYVCNSGTNTVTVIDGSDNSTATVTVGTAPTAVAVNPITNKIYVANLTSDNVTVIDGLTNAPTTFAVGTSPRGVAVNPVTNRIYVANSGSNNATVIDGTNNSTTTVAVGTFPSGSIAVNPITNKIYVVGRNIPGTLTVIDGITNSTATLFLGSLSNSVTVNPNTNKIYVTNGGTNDLTIVDGTNNAMTTVALGVNPTPIEVNPITGKVYAYSNNINVITPAPTSAIPLTVAVTLDNSTTPPTFNFTVSNSFSPTAPPVRQVYYQVDTWQGTWLAAAPAGSSMQSAQPGTLPPGIHTLYAYATEGEDATSTNTAGPLIGNINALVFLAGGSPAVPPGTITSATTGNWSNPATWTGGVVPTSANGVIIQNGHTVTIDSSNAMNVTVQSGGILQFEQTTARTLTVATSVTIDLGGTFRSNPAGTQTGHVLSVGTDLTNNGTLDFSTNSNTAGASILFNGAANNTFSGTGATTDIRGLTLNKGTSNANILEITTANLTVQGVNTDVAGFLTLTNGTLKISGAFTMANRVFTTPAYTIPATGGIWLNNPNFTVAGTASGTTSGNDGLLRLTQGVYTIGVTAADGFDATTATGTYNIEGGTLNANGRFDPHGTVNYMQSGGTINCAIVGNNRSGFGSFEILGTTSSFTMSGGTINLRQPSTGSPTKDDYSMTALAAINITGGQVVFGATGAPAGSTYTIASAPSTSFIANIVVNPTMTLNINNVFLIFLGTTIINNGAITSTGTNPGLDFSGSAPMNYSGSGTLGTLAAPFGGFGVGAANVSPVTLDAPIVSARINLFTGGFIHSNQITLGTGGASSTFIQVGGSSAQAPAGTFDVSPIHNQGTGGQTVLYQPDQTQITRTTGLEINPTRVLTRLQVDNTNGVIVAGGDLTVTTTLTMNNGRIITGANKLIVSPGAPNITRTNGYVDGNLQKTFTLAENQTFEVGTANGYTPASVNVTTGTLPAAFTVSAVQGPQPNLASPQYALQRYWKVSTPASVTADLAFLYLDPIDIPATANENTFVVFRHESNGQLTTPLPQSVNTAGNFAIVNGVTSFSDWTLAQPNAPSAAPATLSGVVSKSDGTPLAGVTVNLSGDHLAGGTRTITDANGQYRFDNIETDGFYVVTPGLTNYSFNPVSRAFTLLANKTDAAFTATAAVETDNPLNGGDFFVRQQYLDFLGREPDRDGWLYWTDQISRCGQDQNCIQQKRLDVSAAFFISDEFQQSGDYVNRIYRAALGRQITYAEFTADHQRVVGGSDLQALRTQFAEAFVARPEFVARYQTAVLAETFVDALLQSILVDTRVDLASQREALIASYNNGGDLNHSRSAVLRAVADQGEFKNAAHNSSFVLMEYFGYLQRDPEQSGYDFWLNVLNRSAGNYRGMVCSFITAAEYQRRFSPIVNHTNAECGQ